MAKNVLRVNDEHAILRLLVEYFLYIKAYLLAG